MVYMNRLSNRPAPRLYVREWMEHQNVTQNELADALDCKQATVSRLVTGKMQWTLEWMAAFSFALGIQTTDLFDHPDSPDPAAVIRKLPLEKQQQAIEFLKFLSAKTGS